MHVLETKKIFDLLEDEITGKEQAADRTPGILCIDFIQLREHWRSYTRTGADSLHSSFLSLPHRPISSRTPRATLLSSACL